MSFRISLLKAVTVAAAFSSSSAAPLPLWLLTWLLPQFSLLETGGETAAAPTALSLLLASGREIHLSRLK